MKRIKRISIRVRVASFLFCMGFICVLFMVLGVVNNFQDSWLSEPFRFLLKTGIAVFTVVGVLDLCGIDLFRSLRVQ